jgi:hypothetical protein
MAAEENGESGAWNVFLSRLSTRAYNVLRHGLEREICSLEALADMTAAELLRTPNLGKLTLEELAVEAEAVGAQMPWDPRPNRGKKTPLVKRELAGLVRKYGNGVVRAALDDLDAETGNRIGA